MYLLLLLLFAFFTLVSFKFFFIYLCFLFLFLFLFSYKQFVTITKCILFKQIFSSVFVAETKFSCLIIFFINFSYPQIYFSFCFSYCFVSSRLLSLSISISLSLSISLQQLIVNMFCEFSFNDNVLLCTLSLFLLL